MVNHMISRRRPTIHGMEGEATTKYNLELCFTGSTLSQNSRTPKKQMPTLYTTHAASPYGTRIQKRQALAPATGKLSSEPARALIFFSLLHL